MPNRLSFLREGFNLIGGYITRQCCNVIKVQINGEEKKEFREVLDTWKKKEK